MLCSKIKYTKHTNADFPTPPDPSTTSLYSLIIYYVIRVFIFIEIKKDKERKKIYKRKKKEEKKREKRGKREMYIKHFKE